LSARAVPARMNANAPAGRHFERRVVELCLVTDPSLDRGRLLEVVRAAVAGGVTSVQLREKGASTREFVERARMLMQVLAPAGVPLIVNDRIDVALASGADGVHVGQSDMSVAEVRRWLPDAIVGLSVERIEHVLEVESRRLAVDYLGVSPVFATASKLDAAPPLGLDGLAAIRDITSLPLVAIGGIAASNAAAVIAAGADGLAVVSAICGADDPLAAARLLRDALRARR
jgi:thiamine-phosphate pyrophosphorylase